jgi:hypothetical protein
MQRTITALLEQFCSLATATYALLPADRNQFRFKLTLIRHLMYLKEASLGQKHDGQTMQGDDTVYTEAFLRNYTG